MISAARNRFTSEEEPWCIGKSAKTSIPADANGDLLHIWKRCKLAGRKFSMREAKWVANLRTAVDGGDIYTLAAKYALRERVWEMDDEKNREEFFDTTDMDASLAFIGNYWGYQTSIRTEVLSRYEVIRPIIELGKLARLGIAADSIPAHAITNMRPGELQYVLSIGDFDEWRETNELSDEADEVYALWLRKLRESPNWPATDDERRKQIADRLFEEVVKTDNEYKNSLELSQSEIQKEYGDSDKAAKEIDYAKARVIFASANWEPSEELLREVGLQS